MFEKKITRIGWFVAFMLVTNSMTIIPFSWGIIYYAVLLLVMIFLLQCARRLNMAMVALYAVAALSIIMNPIPDFFKPWSRLGTFMMLTFVVSPVLVSETSTQFKVQLFAAVSLLLTIATVISTGLYFTGRGYSSNIHSPYFQGAMCHSMIMGPVAGISNLFCLYQVQYPQRKQWIKYMYYVFIICGLLCVMQTGSRAALIGSVVSLISFMFFRNKNQFITMVRKYFLLIMVVVASYPIWIKYMDNIEEKNKGESTLNTDSREIHWNQRITEWKSSPIWGIGFSAVDAEAESSNFDRDTGNVETGSSWLCTLSMTGILGFLCVLGIFITTFKQAWYMTYYSPATGSFLLSILIFFIFHMMAEGYIFAGGNFLNTQLWLLLGTIYSISYYPEYGEILEQKLQFHL